MPDVLFLGGPCAGQENAVSDADIADGFTVCRATTYHVYRIGDSSYQAVTLNSAEQAQVASTPDVVKLGPDVLTTSSALGGWNNLTHALTVGAPRGLRAAERARRTIRSV